MSDSAVRVSGLGKQYRLGHVRESYPTVREAVSGGMRQLLRGLGSAIGREGQRRSNSDLFWALKDVSFEIRCGEAVGVIGGNGAGKSTLLKVLSQVTAPTAGYAEVHGRVGSLLEIGTGFHPELTGRENIYLNGAILGMKRTEINRKFEQIVEFAEVARFLDTAVKHYSSGMYLRLAFAVAAHLESEILLVDEVLAVGDAAFQRKCLGKMNDVASHGRTVLFVSHNMDAIRRLCSRCLLIEKGILVLEGDSSAVVSRYLSRSDSGLCPNTWRDLATVPRSGRGGARFVAVRYSSLNQAVGDYAYPGGPLEFDIVIASEARASVESMAVTLYTQTGTKLINADTVTQGRTLRLERGRNTIRLRLEQLHLKPGMYVVGLWLGHVVGTGLDCMEAAFQIGVVQAESMGLGVTPRSDGVVPCRFTLSQVESQDFTGQSPLPSEHEA